MSFGAAAFGSTAFGATPGVLADPVRQVTGFRTGAFGSPTATWQQFGTGAGAIAPTINFGLGHVVPGWVPSLGKVTTFGAPSGIQKWVAASLGVVTKMPRAYYAFHFTGATTGRRTTMFGTSWGLRTSTVAVPQSASAFGMRATAFGSPSAAWHQTMQTTGTRTTAFGAPAAVRGGTATGIYSTHFGTFKVALSQSSTAIHTTAFGAVKAQQVQAATGLLASTQFGTPTSSRSRAYLVSGFARAGRFGLPTGFSRHNYGATAIYGTHLGTPNSKVGHRITMIPPTAHFGTPLLTRSTIC